MLVETLVHMTYLRKTAPCQFCLRFLALITFTALAMPSLGSVRITEFLAENDGELHDADGSTPDWIEIHNDSASPVNLAGWRLTDDPADLAQWTFPATNVAPGGFLVVFASGKNRVIPGQELHTNFQLNNTGEYLALVRPDGGVEHEYTPAYPPQRRNASFGLETTTIKLLSKGAGVRYIVPSSAALGTTWTARTFNDGSWTASTNALGYDRGQGGTNPDGTVVLAVDFNERGVTPVTEPGFLPFLIDSDPNNTAIQTNATQRVFNGITVTLSNAIPHGYDDRLRNVPTNNGAFTESALLRDLVLSRDTGGTGGLEMALSGLLPSQKYAVTIWSLDATLTSRRVSDWFAQGSLVMSNYNFLGTVPPVSNDQYRFTFETETTPQGGLTISGYRDVTSAANVSVVLNAFRLTQLGYRGELMGDVETAMYQRNGSIYSRMPFTVTKASELRTLTVKVRYDDGFIAYINGQLVGSRNAPATPAYNSLATAVRPLDNLAVLTIPVTPGLLADGNNTLALHGLNSAAGDNDFFLEAEVEAEVMSSSGGLYFKPTTPGLPNSTGYTGFVEDTKFSVNRGFFDIPFTVAITSATPGATIYWTTNGSPPSPTNGIVYSYPIPVSRTLPLRAVAYAPGLIPTDMETHSYIFLQQVLQQSDVQPGYPTVWQASYPADFGMDPNVVTHPVYSQTISNDLRSIPTLSIVTAHDVLWGTTGIYRDANRRDEHPASVELIHPDGRTEFMENCGLEMHGNASRDNVRTPKHSMRISFKSKYGPARLNYNWFGGQVRDFDSLVLRGLGFGDAWATRYSDSNIVPGTNLRGLRYRPESSTYLKDTWLKEALGEMGHLSPRSDFVHVYINGLYWGLYNPSERVDAAYVASHLGGREMDWDVMNGDAVYHVAELQDGLRYDWDALIAEVNAGITTESSYRSVSDKVDVVNLIDYMLVHGITEMEDWPFHNWFTAHRRATNGMPATKWVFITWDQEIGMDRYMRRERILGGADSDNTPGRIYTKLRAYPEFRVLYGDRVQKHFFNGGLLTRSNSIARFQRLGSRIFDALVPESARWGDAREFPTPSNPATGQTFTRDEWWVPEMQQLYDGYFGDLNERYLAVFRANGLYPLTDAPQFNQFGGAVQTGFGVTLSNPNPDGAIFYTVDGRDPREYGTGNVAAGAMVYSAPITVNRPLQVTARVLDSRGWSAVVQTVFYPPQDFSRLLLTEVMYNPRGSGITDSDEFEFIELKNAGTNTLDLSGLTFTEGITFTFETGTSLAPGSFIVLGRNASAFSMRYPGLQLGGLFTGRLDNGGETITLSLPTGGPVLSFSYSDSAPWPLAADGSGFSLVPLTASTQASDDAARWRASTNPGGSPAADDPAPLIAPVLISEVLTHSDLPQLDSIELHNPTSTNVNVSGWLLTDSASEPRKFRIPDNTIIGPGGYVVFDTRHFDPVPGVPPGFAFSEFGDSVYLFSADAQTNLTGYSHGFDFQAADNGVSFGIHLNSIGEQSFPAQLSRTLGTNNAGPRVAPVVISEINYNPSSNGCEFVELFNHSPQAVALFDPTAPTNTWRLNGVSFNLPANVVIPAGGFVVLAATNPAAFRAIYDVPANAVIYGPYLGNLQNSGEMLELVRPTSPDPTGSGWIVVDEVRYNDKDPWPAAADGAGSSLQRKSPPRYGSEPLEWFAATPNPGTAAGPLDSDNDGILDDWESAYQLDPNVPFDAREDADGDGLSNLQEYLSGSNPRDPASRFMLTASISAGAGVLVFEAGSNVVYTLEACAALSPEAWTAVQTWAATSTNRIQSHSLPPGSEGEVFYRLRARR